MIDKEFFGTKRVADAAMAFWEIYFLILTWKHEPSVKSEDCIQGITPFQNCVFEVSGVPPPMVYSEQSPNLYCSQERV